MPRSPDARPVRAYIGLGGNLDQPAARIRQARAALAVLPNTREAAFSRLYRSAPMGPADQPDYVNAVMALDTELEPIALLDHLQAIESAQGRVRLGERWGPRTLDLDLLLYGEDIIEHERLTVPTRAASARVCFVPAVRDRPRSVDPRSGSPARLGGGLSASGTRGD